MFLLRSVVSWLQPEPVVPLSLGEIEELLDNCHFPLAYKKAKAALDAGEDKERCLTILSSAAYEMCKWEEAADHYKELCKEFPSNQDAQDGLRAAVARLDEARSGKFDFESLHTAALMGETDVDVADYMGPIEVVDIPGKGKGIVATQDVKKGTLLLVSKAFAIVDRGGPALELPKKLEKNLIRHREKADEVAALHYGGERNADTMTWKSLMTGPRLLAICRYNTFGTVTGEDGQPEVSKPTRMCGLWLMASYFNHSCLQNVHRRFYGDVMTVHAIMDIKKGEEMTLTYIAPIETYKDRAAHLMKGYAVLCECRLCELDRADPRREEREQLIDDMLKPLTTTPKNTATKISILTECLNKVRETYADRQELMTLLYPPLKSLANVYQGKRELGKAVKCLHEAIQHVPESAMSVYGVNVYMQLAECYDRMYKPKLARKYARMAADLHLIRSGHDDELFRQIYSHLERLV